MVDRFEVKGARELERKLQRLSAAASGRAIRTAVGFAMTPVLKEARSNAPIGTTSHKTHKGRVVAPGFLSRSIKKKTKLSRNKGSAFAWIQADSEAFYGRYTEKGTVNITAQPWLRPAMKDNKRLVKNRYADKLRDRIRIEAAK